MEYLKTKDGQDIMVGAWYDYDGSTYEVRDVTSDEVVLREIIFQDSWDMDADPDAWDYGYYLDLTHEEASELSYC